MIPLAVLQQYVKVFFGEHGLELHDDGDQREFDLKTRVITNRNLIIPEMFHSYALNK